MLFLLCGTLLQAQIDRMEPPFWWSGMERGELQVMFHGKNIAQYQVSASEDITIKNVIKTENPNYIFVTLDTQGH